MENLNTPAPTGVLFFDTETTGLPVWKEPSGSEVQPHIVQLAAELVDPDTREVIDSMNVIVKPDGWVIPPEMAEIHGITHEHAMEVGIPESEAVAMLVRMRAGAALRVAHNRQFDDRIVRIGLKRFFDVLGDGDPEGDKQPSEEWRGGEGACTCQQAKKAMGVKKLPTLQEAHVALIGHEFAGAHSAMEDVRACKSIYFAIQDQAVSQAA